ncbi:MAG: DUF1800 domain-containing protein, partial [Propionibacteriaceae bacterium]|nr:DUF1800 domain-containing protein [Propionibacteriaceae bacterium]
PRSAEPGTERVKPSKADKKEWRQSRREQHQQLTLWWLDRMVMAEQQATERLTWFWHGHFATSNQKVKNAQLMLAQNETMRRLGLGDFRQLAQAMIIDPAMLIWLDGNNNTAKAPNENLSREFLELFSLGHGNYSEHDVREAARALTGWKINRSRGTAMLRPGQHDSGVKDILGSTGAFEAKSFVTLVVGQQSSARFVASRLWFRLVSATPPSPAALARLTAAYGPGRNITSLLRAITREPAFTHTATSIVKQPVEWTVGLMRALNVRPTLLEPQQQRRLTVTLRGMGQLPFLPPSVGGWPAGGGWLTTAGALSRMEAARLITSVAHLGTVAQRSAPRARVDYIRRLLGVDAFSPRTVNAISQVAGDFPAAVAVAASSPQYTVSR